MVVPMAAILKNGFGLGGRFDRALRDQVAPISKIGTDEYGMELALLESMNSVGISAPNPPVGCVIMLDGKVLSTGFTQTYKKEHAEKMAWKHLPKGSDLKRATAYVTLEPCAHVGFQPPCVDLMLSSEIGRVVIGSMDPDSRVSGEGIRQLKEAGKEVVVGVLQNEVRAWLFPFMQSKNKSVPIWVAKWAQTSDGYLADANGNSKWITNEKSRAYTHWLRQKYDAIVVGAQTFLTDQPQLTARDCASPIQRQPKRFVFDPQGKILKAGQDFEGFTLIVCESKIPKSFDGDSSILAISGAPTDGALAQKMKQTIERAHFDRPLQSIFVEGGARFLNLCMDSDIFDAAHVFVGIKKFEKIDPRFLVQWKPGMAWTCAAEQSFDQDYLREWVKGDLISKLNLGSGD